MASVLAMLSASHVVQGIIIGGVLAFTTANIIIDAVVKTMMSTMNLRLMRPPSGFAIDHASVYSG